MENKMTTPKASDTRTAEAQKLADEIKRIVRDLMVECGPAYKLAQSCLHINVDALATLAAADAVPVAGIKPIGWVHADYIAKLGGGEFTQIVVGSRKYDTDFVPIYTLAHPQQAAVPAGQSADVEYEVVQDGCVQYVASSLDEARGYANANGPWAMKLYEVTRKPVAVEQQGEAK